MLRTIDPGETDRAIAARLARARLPGPPRGPPAEAGDVPVDRGREPLLHAAQRPVPEERLRFADVGLREAHVALAELPVDRLESAQLRIARLEQRADRCEQLIKSRLVVQRDVVHL